MHKKILVLAFAAFSMTLSSCFKDEPLNAECDIEQAYIHAEDPSVMFVKLTDSIANTNETARVVTFSVRQGTDLTAVAPLFRITDGATISPPNGSVHDFSAGSVNYTVTSQDGAWSKTYTVRISEVADHSPQFDFEHFFLEPNKQKYYIWTDLADDGTQLLNWASGNAGFAIVGGSKPADQYPTSPLDEGYKGHGVRLVTRSTGAAGNVFKMPIAAGNLFTGEFIVGTATTKPLESTHFGSGDFCVITRKPLRLTGYYQYAPGATVTDRNKKVVEGVTDQGDIYAVLFRNEATDASGNTVPFYLDGTNVKTSPQIVAIASAGNISRTEGGWQRLDAKFEYRAEIDPQILAARGYSLAVVCTSSIEGANFQGAIGSELLVDELRVIVEE